MPQSHGHSPAIKESIMIEPVTRAFAKLTDAERARDALLTAGFGNDEVELISTIDEAGAVKGNFTVGNGDERPGGLIGAIDHAGGGDNHNYGSNYTGVNWGGAIVLIVKTDDTQRRAQAEQVLERASTPLV
jgi:hypothetical protein